MTLVLSFLITVSAHALDIPSRPDGYVTDRAGILSPQAKQELEQNLQQYEQQTSNQIIVATFPSLESESLEDFSIRLAESWKVGQKGHDNGILFLIFPNDHKMRIEVGYGLEGVLPDALAGAIIQQVVAPLFRENKFDEGILQGVGAITQTLKGENPLSASEEPVRKIDLPIRPILYLILILFVVDSIRYLRYRSHYRSLTGRYTFTGWWLRFAALCFLINLIFRIIFYSMLFSRGGMYGGGGRSGGFSGGGGRFGGGGASGGW